MWVCRHRRPIMCLLGIHAHFVTHVTHLLGVVHLLTVDKLLVHQHKVAHIVVHGGAPEEPGTRAAVVVLALLCARRGGGAVLALAAAAPCTLRRCRAGRWWPHARRGHVPLETPAGVGLGGQLGGDLAGQHGVADWIRGVAASHA